MRNFLTIIVMAIFVAAFFPGGQNYFHARATTLSTTTDGNLQYQSGAIDQQIVQLNQQIAQYQAKLKNLGTEKKTLKDAINALNLRQKKIGAQIALTQRQINITELQIQKLGSGILSTGQIIAENQSALEANIRGLQEIEDQPPLVQFLSSASLSDIWNYVDAMIQIQKAVNDRVQELKIQKNVLTDDQTASKQKQNTLLAQKKSLASQQTDLIANKQSEEQLLADTKSKESNYQKLLAQAKAELNSFTAFTKNAGGAALLVNQTSCDGWGCYYNQRDAAWGNDPLDGTQYRLASDGCLVTAMAMVMTHYGYRDVTPVTINSDPNNFAVYYPAYLLFVIHVDGITATRKTAAIDAILATGNPVVVGLHAYGGTHFIVLTKGQNGNYLMRDPYLPNGKDINFSSHYSLDEIYEISRVEIS